MAKPKLNPQNLKLRQPAGAGAKRPAAIDPAAADRFIEGQGERPRRGRPPSPIAKKGVMMYVPEELHDDFREVAEQVEQRPMNDILAELMRDFVESRRKALAEKFAEKAKRFAKGQ